VQVNPSFATIPEIPYLEPTGSNVGADNGVLFPGTALSLDIFGPTLFATAGADVPLPASALRLGGIAALGATRRRRA
jgi:hypothetical protein